MASLLALISITLITPCKCPKVIHHQCLINQCLFLLSFKFDERNYVYSIDFKPKRIRVIGSIIISAIMIIVLIVIGLIFCFKLLLPHKFLFWNYIIGLILFSLALDLSFIVIYNQQRYKLIYGSALVSQLNHCNSGNSQSNCNSNSISNSDNYIPPHLQHRKGKEYYDIIKDYFKSSYQMNYLELTEQKIALNDSLRLLKQNDINDYVKQCNSRLNQ